MTLPPHFKLEIIHFNHTETDAQLFHPKYDSNLSVLTHFCLLL